MKANKRPTRIQASSRRRLALLLVVALAGAGALYWRHQRPRALYEEALQLIDSRPDQAERLLEESVDAAGGSYPDAQLLRCRALGGMNRWDAALGLFSMIERPSQCDTDELMRLAQAATNVGAQQLAIEALSAANRPGPRQASVLRQLIPLEIGDASTQKALEHCQLLQQLAPDTAFGWQIEGNILQSRKEPLAAVRAFQRALQCPLDQPAETEIRSDLAGALIDVGELAMARDQIEWLLARSHPSRNVLLKEAYLLRLEGRPDVALQKANALVGEAPDSASALMLRGILQLDLGKNQAAVADLSRVVALEPFNKEAHYKLAKALEKTGESAKAATHLARSAELTRCAVEILDVEAELHRQPENRTLTARLAALYEQTGRVEDAERLRRQAPSGR